jgi:hypothetical protein
LASAPEARLGSDMSRIRHWVWPGLMFGLAGPACTLVSGWSDLQGVPTSGTDGGRRDGAANPNDETGAPPTSADGGAEADATSTAPKEKCAGVECGAGQICCFTAGVGRDCRLPSACDQADNAFILNCQSKAGCASGDCCLDYTTFVATCRPECGPGTVVLCDPEKPQCPTGQQCTRNVATAQLKGCQ